MEIGSCWRTTKAPSALCASPQVARRIAQVMPPQPSFALYDRKPPGPDRELLDFEDNCEMNFALRKEQGRWRVAAVKVEKNY